MPQPSALPSRIVGAAARRVGALHVDWAKPDNECRIAGILRRRVVRLPAAPDEDLIEQRVRLTAAAGDRPLWEGYGEAGATRSSDEVRTQAVEGRFYCLLVQRLLPSVVVEFGTAFGVSGMYWLSGLSSNGAGELLTFEPNAEWASLARENLSAISDSFTLTNGTFEDHAVGVLGDRRIDVAFIDAIHTSEFVGPQFELVASHGRPGSVIILDDINFSEDMASCWKLLSRRSDVRAAATISQRVGVLELA